MIRMKPLRSFIPLPSLVPSKIIYSGLLILFASIISRAQTTLDLYSGVIPNSVEHPDEETNKNQIIGKVSKPTITVFPAAKETANGAAVIICPGGGYGVLVIDREGYEIAKAFNKIGVTGLVLKYRLPSEKTMEDKSLGPLQDAQQSIKLAREHAEEWNIDPDKIGIMGFSAGGHLAATAGTHYDSSLIENINGRSLRPDFMILVYPVISMLDKVGHKGSGINLLGTTPTEAKVRYFSNELQVMKTAPPAFITHASDDTVVPVANSLRFYEALQKVGVSTAMHIYAKGEHGYLKEPVFDEWFGRVKQWLKVIKMLPNEQL
jgi:acetyl esterase/lipase